MLLGENDRGEVVAFNGPFHFRTFRTKGEHRIEVVVAVGPIRARRPGEPWHNTQAASLDDARERIEASGSPKEAFDALGIVETSDR